MVSLRRWLRHKAMLAFSRKTFPFRDSTSAYELLPASVSLNHRALPTNLRIRSFVYMACTLLAVLVAGIVISGLGKLDPGEFRSQDLKSLTDPRPSAKRLSLSNASIDMLREGLAQRHFTSVDLVNVSPNI